MRIVPESRRLVKAGTEASLQSPSRADPLKCNVSGSGSPVTGEELAGVLSDCRAGSKQGGTADISSLKSNDFGDFLL